MLLIITRLYYLASVVLADTVRVQRITLAVVTHPVPCHLQPRYVTTLLQRGVHCVVLPLV